MTTFKASKLGWVSIGRKHYRHTVTGIELKQNLITNRWQPIGGKNDGASGYAKLYLAMWCEAGTPILDK